MTCASCSSTITRTVSDIAGVSEVAVNLLGNSATVLVDHPKLINSVVEAIEDAGYEVEVVSTEPLNAQLSKADDVPHNNFDGPFQLTLSVGGMTCASCTNTVTALASDMSGVSDVAVSLIGKSATVVIHRKDLADQLAQAIEDAGYEVDIVSIEPLHSAVAQIAGPRTIALRIGGMFCP